MKTKDLNKSEPGIKELAKGDFSGTARLRNFGGGGEVRITWGRTRKMKENKVFEITVDGKSALIDLEQLLWYTRAM